jgi:hypothetical protein
VRPPPPAFLPRGGRSPHLGRKWGPSRGHAESEAESPLAALSLAPGPAKLRLPKLEPTGTIVPGDRRDLFQPWDLAAGRGLQGPDWCWTHTPATPREPRADSFHDVPVGAAAAPPAQRPGQ